MTPKKKTPPKKNSAKKPFPLKLFILSGPGGAGKTTLLNKLFRRAIIRKNFIRGISYTTRKRRPGERGSKDYFFVSKSKFLALKRKKFFLESEKIINDYYGTPEYFYRRALREKKDLILCIDVKGGMHLQKSLKIGKIVTVFISAPDKETLYRRLKKRAESRKVIERRIKLAKHELRFSQNYDYFVVNKTVKTSLSTLEAIFLEEVARRPQ